MNPDSKDFKGVVGFTCGAFDLLHPGHLYLLTECKLQCDILVVGLHTDPSIDRSSKNRPLQTTFERWYQLSNLSIVDSIIPYDTERDLEHLLGVLPINVRFLGWDYMDKSFTGDRICKDRGIEIKYVPRSHNWSSSELRMRIANEQRR